MNTVYKLNSAVENGEIKDVIMLDEALHEKKIANIADDIAKNRNIKTIQMAEELDKNNNSSHIKKLINLAKEIFN